ncbi:sugar ABC transporter ATP-binding protein [Microlunatus parietis]|uniref:Ribose transport system ATP-binding protein n=1 Tax=Microlunatus parietis TaxID=682979 RepID=A0A7Y9LB78_9ACTN|nr:sugar ABC transporter ATP-binding protein [Microlunatus parietis]NYE70350.1 ribose transport system ATP-binding protein [Microlunatus parietis]
MTHGSESAPGEQPAAPLVELRGISKRFGGVLACRDIDLEVRPGEVHALLGENGAGKSTCMNILSGVITDFDGSLLVRGRPARFGGPADAQAAGIAIIHQELDLVGDLTVAENMFLGRELRTPLRTIDLRSMRAAATEQLGRLGISIDVRRTVRSLRVGERQLVEIARALLLDAAVLIMDEPTASLADAEVRQLFRVIDNLRRDGVGIVYISHRMEEIEEIADRATVLRNGAVAGSVPDPAGSRETIITLMVGSKPDQLFGDESQPASTAAAEPVLSVRGLRYRRRWPVPGRTDPNGIDLDVRPGEIVGLAGLMGAGRTELLETLYGAAAGGRVEGMITVAGRRYRPSRPARALRQRIAFVPEDRRGSGLVLDHSVQHNLILAALASVTRFGVVLGGRERAAVRGQVSDLAIRAASPRVPVGTLSGGNQQKVVFGRQLLTGPRVLLLDEPTRGVDIGAKAEIYRLLHRLAAVGTAVLLASSELPELTGVCDRILVLRRGRIAAELPGDADHDQILALAMGDDNSREATR